MTNLSISYLHCFHLDNIERLIDSMPEIFLATLKRAGTEDSSGFMIALLELSATVDELKKSLDAVIESEKS